MPRDIYLDKPEYITDLFDESDSDALSAFDAYNVWLTAIGMTTDQALLYFVIDYNRAHTRYKKQWIMELIRKTAAVNARKYDKLITAYTAVYDPIQNYDRTEDSTHIREPDITRTGSTTTGSTTTREADSTNEIKQTHTTTTAPNAYTTTTQHDVAPYDTSSYQPETKDTTTETGSTATTDTYTGSPDEQHSEGIDTTSGTSSGTETETGTDTTTIESHIYGNIGVTTSQQMLEAEIELGAKLVVWHTIEQDIAEAICLQVW